MGGRRGGAGGGGGGGGSDIICRNKITKSQTKISNTVQEGKIGRGTR